jgi:hypothetical protein
MRPPVSVAERIRYCRTTNPSRETVGLPAVPATRSSIVRVLDDAQLAE